MLYHVRNFLMIFQEKTIIPYLDNTSTLDWYPDDKTIKVSIEKKIVSPRFRPTIFQELLLKCVCITPEGFSSLKFEILCMFIGKFSRLSGFSVLGSIIISLTSLVLSEVLQFQETFFQRWTCNLGAKIRNYQPQLIDISLLLISTSLGKFSVHFWIEEHQTCDSHFTLSFT